MSRVAIVTGAAGGIGSCIASRLAADGCHVAVLDLRGSDAARVATAIEQTGSRALPLCADISDPAASRAAVEEVVRHLGPPTVLVNSAGLVRDDLVFNLSDSDWDVVLDVNLRGTFLMTKAVVEHMAKQGSGRVVNLSSIAAVGNVGQANYSAAKAGVEGLTKTLAMELGPLNVTVNAVAPGFIDSEMTAAAAARAGRSVEEHRSAAAAQIPLRRVGRPQEVAAVVSFLAGDQASFVSGQVVHVAGGPVC